MFVISQILETGRALICPNTPSVLSVGRRCIDCGWHFEWPPFSYSPFMVKPDGTIVWMIFKNYVPVLRDQFDSQQGVLQDTIMYAKAAAAKRRYGGKQPLREEDEGMSTTEAAGSADNTRARDSLRQQRL